MGKVKYYNMDDIAKKYPTFRTGCKTRAEKIDRNCLTKKDYIYGKLCNNCKNDEECGKCEECDGGWVPSSGTSKTYDKVLIKKTWVDPYIDRITRKVEIVDDTE